MSDEAVPISIGTGRARTSAGVSITLAGMPGDLMTFGSQGGLDNFANDPYYFGGPYAVGYRGNTIDAELAKLVGAKSASASGGP